MNSNLQGHDANVQSLEAHKADRAIRYAQPGAPGDGDWPPIPTYSDGYAEGHAAGEAHGKRLADIEHMFAADDAERRGYERGRQDGIAECGWPMFWRELGSWVSAVFWWLVVLGFIFVILADTFQDGKEAGLKEARTTVNIEKKADAR